MVEEFNVIDAAGPSPDGRFGLMMFEPRDWKDPQRQVDDLNKKTQVYFSYVVDGDLAKDNPAHKDREVWFRVVCQVAPPAIVFPILRNLHSALAKHNIDFQLSVHDPNDNTSINKLIQF